MNPVVAIYGCFERWNIFASNKNDRSPVSPLVRSREWAKSEFNVGHSRVAVQSRKAQIVGALAHCDEERDLLELLVAMTVADHAKEKDLTALPVKQPWRVGVDDLEAECALLRQRGVEVGPITELPISEGGATIALCYLDDPDGNKICFYQVEALP